MFRRPSAEGRFILEIDGVSAIVATEVTAPGYKHTPVKHQPGNRVRPQHVRGNVEIEELTFKHARAINDAGLALLDWLVAFGEGDAVELKNVRFITKDESGRTTIETMEMTDCLPTMYKPESGSGSGTNVALFSFSLQPDNVYVY